MNAESVRFSGLWLHVGKSLCGEQKRWNTLTQMQPWNPLDIILLSFFFSSKTKKKISQNQPHFADRTLNNNRNMEVEGLAQIFITQRSAGYTESQETQFE